MRSAKWMILLIAVLAAAMLTANPRSDSSLEKRVEVLEAKVTALEQQKVPSVVTLTNCRSVDARYGTPGLIPLTPCNQATEVVTGVGVSVQNITAQCCTVGLK